MLLTGDVDASAMRDGPPLQLAMGLLRRAESSYRVSRAQGLQNGAPQNVTLYREGQCVKEKESEKKLCKKNVCVRPGVVLSPATWAGFRGWGAAHEVVPAGDKLGHGTTITNTFMNTGFKNIFGHEDML